MASCLGRALAGTAAVACQSVAGRVRIEQRQGATRRGSDEEHVPRGGRRGERGARVLGVSSGAGFAGSDDRAIFERDLLQIFELHNPYSLYKSCRPRI